MHDTYIKFSVMSNSYFFKNIRLDLTDALYNVHIH